MMNVWMGFTLGRTAKTVSPTSPLDVDATPDSLTAITSSAPRFTTIVGISSQSTTPSMRTSEADLSRELGPGR